MCCKLTVVTLVIRWTTFFHSPRVQRQVSLYTGHVSEQRFNFAFSESVITWLSPRTNHRSLIEFVAQVMGLLNQGTPLDWTEISKSAKLIKREGIKQFIRLFNKCKNRRDERFKWGDEVEFMMVRFDHENRNVQLLLKAKQLLELMDRREEEEGDSRKVHWSPELGSFMMEGTPGQPFGEFGFYTKSPKSLP